jgi:hypothetical protein
LRLSTTAVGRGRDLHGWLSGCHVSTIHSS